MLETVDQDFCGRVVGFASIRPTFVELVPTGQPTRSSCKGRTAERKKETKRGEKFPEPWSNGPVSGSPREGDKESLQGQVINDCWGTKRD